MKSRRRARSSTSSSSRATDRDRPSVTASTTRDAVAGGPLRFFSGDATTSFAAAISLVPSEPGGLAEARRWLDDAGVAYRTHSNGRRKARQAVKRVHERLVDGGRQLGHPKLETPAVNAVFE